MDFSETIKNPWVIGGGVIVGLFILMMGKGGGTANAAPNNAPYMYGYATSTGQQQAVLQATLAEINSKDEADFRSTMVNELGASYNFQVSMSEIQAGITKGQIASATALALDRMDNTTRVTIGRQSVDMTTINANASMHNADTMANAQVKSSQIQANASMFSSAIGLIGKFL